MTPVPTLISVGICLALQTVCVLVTASTLDQSTYHFSFNDMPGVMVLAILVDVIQQFLHEFMKHELYLF